MKNHWLDQRSRKSEEKITLTRLFRLVKEFGVDKMRDFTPYELEVFDRFLDKIYGIDEDVHSGRD